MRVLQGEVQEINTELEELKEQWEEYKKPINEEIVMAKQEIADKRVEYKYKQEKIKNLKQEFKGVVLEIEHKKKILEFMQDEWQTMPKDVNRNQYLKKINGLIKDMKMQNTEIRTILEDIKDVRNGTIGIVKQIQQVDVDVEDAVFKETKDKLVKEIYDEIQNLKGMFDTIVGNEQEQNKMRTQIRDIQIKMDDFRIKYKNMTEIEKLRIELSTLQQQNTQLEQRATTAGK